jgi:hypothetical protein
MWYPPAIVPPIILIVSLLVSVAVFACSIVIRRTRNDQDGMGCSVFKLVLLFIEIALLASSCVLGILALAGVLRSRPSEYLGWEVGIFYMTIPVLLLRMVNGVLFVVLVRDHGRDLQEVVQCEA